MTFADLRAPGVRRIGVIGDAVSASLSSSIPDPSKTSLVFGMSLKMLRNHEDAEDNLQNAFCKAYGKIRQFEGNSQFSTWLLRNQRSVDDVAKTRAREGWTNRELAETLDITPASVKSRMFRARARLRQRILDLSKTGSIGLQG